MANVRRQVPAGALLEAAKRKHAWRQQRDLKGEQARLKAEAEARRRGTG